MRRCKKFGCPRVDKVQLVIFDLVGSGLARQELARSGRQTVPHEDAWELRLTPHRVYIADRNVQDAVGSHVSLRRVHAPRDKPINVFIDIALTFNRRNAQELDMSI
jgi:hypothetical protein